MTKIETKVSYIIGYRQSSNDRILGLTFVLKWLKYCFPELEVILVEQDEISKIDFKLPSNCKKHFIYNPGLYNRCWGFNVGAKLSNKELLAFADSDMFMSKNDYLSSFEVCELFEVVNPNGVKTTNVVNVNMENLTFEEKNQKNLWTIAAGLLFMQRFAFDKIGGWDERFEGWGGEDNEMSHVIMNSLSTKTFNFNLYHIDHARSIFDGNNQPQYIVNKNIAEETSTLDGEGLKKYVQHRSQFIIGDEKKYKNKDIKGFKKECHFVVAVTTYNRKLFLQEFLESWIKTRDENAKWTLIIADDGSIDDTLEFVDNLTIKNTEIIFIKNNRNGIAYQFNTIVYALSKLKFDVCFKCDDDILFKKQGWDILYYEVINRTGYDHLCFYDTGWEPQKNLEISIKRGELICHCQSEDIQGCFFTLTPAVIEKVGYMDIQNFGFRGLEHVDYTFRCCRSGFNVLVNPFDVVASNDYILARKDDYIPSIPYKISILLNDDETIRIKENILKLERTFIPRNEMELDIKELFSLENPETEKLSITDKKYANSKIVTNRGVVGFLGSLYKKVYNVFVRYNLFIFIKLHKKVANAFIVIGNDLKNIDKQ